MPMNQAGGMAFGDGVDEQGLRHIEDGGEKGISVKEYTAQDRPPAGRSPSAAA